MEMKKSTPTARKIAGGPGGPIPSRDRIFNLFTVFVLLAFGISQSIIFFGHQAVPNPDFVAFVATGRQLLSLSLPSDYTRAPVLGILIVGLSRLTGGSCPELAAGWLLNAVLYPFNLLLLWLIGKEIVGNSALWVALLAILNPGLVMLLTAPIAETTLLFSVLITIYLIFRQSRWSYLSASVATLVRYEGALLILAAFILDMVNRQTRRERLRTFLCALTAFLPLIIWLLGAAQSRGGIFYLRTINQNRDHLLLQLQGIWEATFAPLLSPVPSSPNSSAIFAGSKIVAASGFVFGMVRGLAERRWKFAVLLIFLAGYFGIHLLYFSLWRYWMPISWIVLLIWWYGLLSFWDWLKLKAVIPARLVTAGLGVILAGAGLRLIVLLADLPVMASLNRMSVLLPYPAMGAIAILCAGRLIFYRGGYWRRDFAVSTLVCLLAVSNHYSLVEQIYDSGHDIEFKHLAEWYRANAGPGEKMVCNMSPLLQLFAPEYENNFIPINTIKAETPQDFIDRCRRRGITYVAWDSRMCGYRQWRFYNSWGLDNIAILSQPRSTGEYEFVIQIINERNPNKIVNVFRLGI